MAIQSNAYKTRLKNEYEELQKLPKNNGLFTVEPAPGETPPYVSRYHVTYTVPTWVKRGGRLVKQTRTVVEVEKMSLSDAPHAKVVEGDIPFHANWYTNGSVCNGSAWATPAMWLYEYMGFVCELLQFKEARINPGSAANHEAKDYWVAHKNDRSRFPTDTRAIPVPVEKKKIQIVKVTRG